MSIGRWSAQALHAVLTFDSLANNASSTITVQTNTASDAAKKIADVGLAVLCIMIAGFILALTKIFPTDKALPYLNKYLFWLGIPCLVFKGLAVQDFLNDSSFNWRFVLLFMAFRGAVGVICLMLSVLAHLYKTVIKKELPSNWDWISNAMMLWIAESYMNTLTFGVPLLAAIYGARSLIFTVYAALSSLFFQIPILLFFFEYRKAFMVNAVDRSIDLPLEDGTELNQVAPMREDDNDQQILTSENDNSTRSIDVAMEVLVHDEHKEKDHVVGVLPKAKQSPAGKIWYFIKFLLYITFTNPPIVGILLGFFYSFVFTSNTSAVVKTPLGVTRFKPYFLDNLVTWLSDSVTPIASFCIGLFAAEHYKGFLKNWLRDFVLLFSKFLLVPLLMIPLVLLLDLKGSQARIALLIAALPIALVVFTIAENYQFKNQVMASQIVWGTILMMPVLIAWDQFMEAIDLFGPDKLRL